MISCPVPTILLDLKTIALEAVELRSDVAEWCREELTEKVSLTYRSLHDRLVYDVPFEITFANETDAILFKMRWM